MKTKQVRTTVSVEVEETLKKEGLKLGLDLPAYLRIVLGEKALQLKQREVS